MASVLSAGALEIAGLGSSSLHVSSRASRNSNVRRVSVGAATGLRNNGGKAALRSTYLKGSEALPAVGGSGRIFMAAAADAYICTDCGYIYNDRRKPFESLDSDYRCPVCASPKRRFGKYREPVARNANDLAVRKARKEQLKKADSAVGAALPILIGLIAVGLVGTVLYLNSQY